MSGADERWSTLGRRVLGGAGRAMRYLAVLVVAVLVAIVVGFTLYATSALPEPEPWHTLALDGEYSAARDAKLDLAGYVERERRMFAAIDAAAAPGGALRDSPRFPGTRWDPGAQVSRLAGGGPFNRTFRLAVPDPRGTALLVHGLTDSPYSMRAFAATLQQQGIDVTVLRLPGHGTLPSAMTTMTDADWRGAVRLAIADVAKRTPAGRPMYVGGYSTGGALVLRYTLDALGDRTLRAPDGVFLFSPAIELPRVAALATLLDRLAFLPLAQIDKVHWQELYPEVDPYKFNSFPVNASRQVSAVTRALGREIAAAAADGRLARMPPVVTFQSAVDSTVGSRGVVDRLYSQLDGAQHRLVLFDVNRERRYQELQKPASEALIGAAIAGPRRYTLVVVTNREGGTREVEARTYAPGSTRPQTRPLDLAWPADVVSVGHVALCFPPDDPVYGYLPGSGANGVASIGTWTLRGESGAVTYPLALLTRLRSNPFWEYVVEEARAVVGDGGAHAVGPTPTPTPTPTPAPVPAAAAAAAAAADAAGRR